MSNLTKKILSVNPSFGLLISIRSFIWYIKIHNIPSSLLSLTSLSSHLKHLIILIFLKLAQFSQYIHALQSIFISCYVSTIPELLKLFRNSWLSLKLVSYFLFLSQKVAQLRIVTFVCCSEHSLFLENSSKNLV